MYSRLGVEPLPLADKPSVDGCQKFPPVVVKARIDPHCVKHSHHRRVCVWAGMRVRRQLTDGDTERFGDGNGHREQRLTLTSLVAPDLPAVHPCRCAEVGLRHAEFGSASANDFGHLHRRSSSRTLPSLDNRTYIADRERQYESAVLRTEESAQKGGVATEVASE